VCLVDREETLSTLEQMRSGAIETLLPGPIRSNERFPMTIAGFGDIPTLHLRARVLSHEAFRADDAAETLDAQRVTLALDHPVEDLKRVTSPLISFLQARDDILALNIA
jgi:hypothetical protein